MNCQVPDCALRVYARKMCNRHYQKWRKHRDPLAPHGNTRHGHNPRGGKESPEHESWSCMLSRCRNPNRREYKDYGGRGIKVCEAWLKFANFLSDMGPKPSPEYTLERIDNNKGYQPGNCRWATRAEQSQNARTNRLITIRGRTQHLAAWAREVGLHHETIRSRLTLGWDATAAVFTPRRSRNVDIRS